MKVSIEKINMNYGKFANESFEFSPTSNLIYGKNETGKSTLFRFIYSMFYGHYKQEYKNLTIDKKLNKLDRPWFAKLYSGSIELNYYGVNYFIYRDFENDELTVRNLSTGEYISFDDPRHVGKKIFALSPLIFKNIVTIDFNQALINKKDRSRLKKDLINSLSISELDFNFDNIKDELIKENNNIGTDRLSKKEIGQINKQIEIVNGKIADIKVSNDEISKLQKLIIKEKEELKICENLIFYSKYIDEMNNTVSLDEYYETLDIYNEYLMLKKDADASTNSSKLNSILISTLIIIITLIFYVLSKNQVSFLLLPLLLIIFAFIKRKKNFNQEKEILDLERKIKESFVSVNAENIDDYKEKLSTNKIPDLTIFSRPEYTCDELEEVKTRLERSIEEKQKTLDQYSYESQLKRNYIEELTDLFKEKNALLEKYKINSLILDAIDYADKMLIDSFNRELQAKISKLVSYLTNGKYRDLLLDSDFNLYVYEEDINDYVSVYQLSSGTIDTINLAYRFALHENNSNIDLPVFLDNVTNYMDSNRKAKFFNFIEYYSRKHQVFFFTNDPSELELVNKYGINIINLSDTL